MHLKLYIFSHWSNNNQTGGGCGALQHWGALAPKKCTNAYPYVCERSLGAPRKCAEGWERFGDSCYKVKSEFKSIKK